MVADIFYFTFFLFRRQNAKREKAKLKRKKRLTSHQSIYVRFLAFVCPFFSFEFRFLRFFFCRVFEKAKWHKLASTIFKIFFILLFTSHIPGWRHSTKENV